jgi:hypothetical protein
MILRTMFGHVKLRRLCKVLPESSPHLVGHLATLFYYVGEHYPSGDISAMTDAEIADAAAWCGDATTFVNAMVAVGFIDRVADRTTVHDWWDHCPQYVKLRYKRSKDKAAALVGQDSTPCRTGCDSLSDKSAPLVGPNRTEPSRTELNRTEPNREDEPPVNSGDSGDWRALLEADECRF